MEKKTIGAFIAVLRKSKGMTQKELGEVLGVSDKAVSRWERDECAPDISMIPVIADLFGVTADELLRGEKATGEITPAAGIKSERTAKYLIRTSVTRFKTKSIIAFGIAAVGLILAAVLNYGVLRAYLAFGIALIFLIVSAVCEIVFAVNALSSLTLDDEENDQIDQGKATVIKTAALILGFNLAGTLSCVPLLFAGNAYCGLWLSTWGVYGLLGFALGALLAFAVYQIVRPSLLPKMAEEKNPIHVANAKLAKKITVVTLIVMLLTGAVQLGLATADFTLYTKGTYFENLDEFVAFMETPYYGETMTMTIDGESDNIAVIEEPVSGDESYEDCYQDELTDEDGNLLCRFSNRNESVRRYDVKTNPDGSIGVRVYTHDDYYESSRRKTILNFCFILLYLAEILAALLIYQKKKNRKNQVDL